ncbi:MAG: LysR family transcriptional regulator [Alphaproteobacteria bacterium]|nr:LysR family transcriptional regulator [Alphaproteobacteria bacterium]
MSIRALRTLAAIEELGSFQRAATRLNMTLSAVSMQVRQLEAEYGFRLFDRNFRPPRFTGEGATLAARAREVLALYDDLPAIARGVSPMIGEVSLGVVASASVRLLPGLLATLLAYHPQARLRVETGLSAFLAGKVATGLLDAAIVTRTPDLDARLQVETVVLEKLVVAAPRSRRRQTGVDLLRRERYIRFQPDTGVGKVIDRFLERTGIVPRDLVVLDSIEAVIECVCHGLGVTIVPEPDARRYGRDRVALMELGRPPLTRALALITRNKPSAKPLHDSLLALIRASLVDAGRRR